MESLNYKYKRFTTLFCSLERCSNVVTICSSVVSIQTKKLLFTSLNILAQHERNITEKAKTKLLKTV